MNARIAGIILTGIFLNLNGCAVAPVDNPRSIASQQYSDAYEAALLALRDHGFELDRQDHRYGVITTQPLVAPTMFEVWHGSNTTAAQAVQATTNHERRIARVFLKPAKAETDKTSQYDMHVEVAVERRQKPVRVITHSTNQRRLSSSLDTVPYEWKQRGIPAQYWTFVSRDDQLEARLMNDIVQRINSDTGAKVDVEED